MGYFRRLKAKDYTLEEAVDLVQRRFEEVVIEMKRMHSRDRCNVALESWACARELLARKQSENHSEVR